MIATLEELDVTALMQILTEPKNALTKQYARCSKWKASKSISAKTACGVAEQGDGAKDGARGLRSILEGILLESMYNIPSQASVAKIVVDESVINGDSEPLLVYETPASHGGPKVAPTIGELRNFCKKGLEITKQAPISYWQAPRR